MNRIDGKKENNKRYQAVRIKVSSEASCICRTGPGQRKNRIGCPVWGLQILIFPETGVAMVNLLSFERMPEFVMPRRGSKARNFMPRSGSQIWYPFSARVNRKYPLSSTILQMTDLKYSDIRLIFREVLPTLLKRMHYSI